jgi:hypothetical protein
VPLLGALPEGLGEKLTEGLPLCVPLTVLLLLGRTVRLGEGLLLGHRLPLGLALGQGEREGLRLPVGLALPHLEALGLGV